MFEDSTCLLKRLADEGDSPADGGSYERTPLSAAAPCVAPGACG
jgi:hypothetical protein